MRNLEIDGGREAFFDSGFLIIDIGIAEDILNDVVDKLEPYWRSKTAPAGVLNHQLQEANLKHGSNRLQDLWEVIPEVKSIALDVHSCVAGSPIKLFQVEK